MSKAQPANVAATTFLIGGVAGMGAKTVIAPFDRVKIVFQTTSRTFRFSSMCELLATIVRTNGLKSLWRGHSLTLTRTFPYAGLQYMAFDKYKSWLTPKGEEDLPPVRRFVAGSMAGATATIAVYPLELLRSRMAVQMISKSSHLSAYQNLLILGSNFGVRGLFFGLKPALIGMVPYGGIAFGSFESLKVFILRKHRRKELRHHERAISGSLSGLVAQTLTYPLDIVRRRMQTDGAHEGSAKVVRAYTSVSQTLRLVYRTEGLRGLFKGVTLNWVKGPVALGISFSTFDLLKAKFNLT